MPILSMETAAKVENRDHKSRPNQRHHCPKNRIQSTMKMMTVGEDTDPADISLVTEEVVAAEAVEEADLVKEDKEAVVADVPDKEAMAEEDLDREAELEVGILVAVELAEALVVELEEESEGV